MIPDNVTRKKCKPVILSQQLANLSVVLALPSVEFAFRSGVLVFLSVLIAFLSVLIALLSVVLANLAFPPYISIAALEETLPKRRKKEQR